MEISENDKDRIAVLVIALCLTSLSFGSNSLIGIIGLYVIYRRITKESKE
jgi:hypothetical protein